MHKYIFLEESVDYAQTFAKDSILRFSLKPISFFLLILQIILKDSHEYLYCKILNILIRKNDKQFILQYNYFNITGVLYSL